MYAYSFNILGIFIFLHYVLEIRLLCLICCCISTIRKELLEKAGVLREKLEKLD